MSDLAEAESHAGALAGLPGMTPVRLAKLLDGFGPALAWQSVKAGTHPADPRRKFAVPARRTDVDDVGRRYAGADVRILLPGGAGYPSMLAGDPGAPAVLFASGDPAVVERRARVAIVGTRSATHYGRQVASELAAGLAEHGVVVVSGLARGIDGAAHAGALCGGSDATGPPVAVVGTGLDVVYPPSNRELWARVAGRGVVFSESALGTQPHPGVFPARNRIIAALSDVVVVVESHHGGGSLYTAEAAARRGIPVCAVPGSVHSRASAGTNGLLVDGCVPVRDATDVLVAVSLARAGQDACAGAPPPPEVPPSPRAHRSGSVRAPAGQRASEGVGRGTPASMTPSQRTVWESVDDTPTAFETILIRTDLPIAAAAEACGQLVERGALRSGAGWWSRR